MPINLNTIFSRKGEAPSANVNSNAYSLAYLTNIMCHKGKNEKIEIISEKTYNLCVSEPTIKFDPVYNKKRT